MKALLRIGFLLSIVIVAPPASAQAQCASRTDSPRNADEALAKLHQLRVDDCLGGSSCDIALCRQFTAWLKAPNGQGALEMLTAIRNSAVSAGNTSNLQNLVDRVDAWIGVVGSDALARSVPAQWQYEIGGGGLFLDTPYAIPLDSSTEARCRAAADACSAAFAEGVEIITDATLVRRLNGQLLAPHRDALVKYVTALDQRWEDYFNETPSQFPWELAVNSLLYQRRVTRGYNEPPRSQWILLHPAAAYEYTDKSSERFKSALALEALGYVYRTTGVAAIVAWSDREDAANVGYGVALHWGNKAMVAAVRHPRSSRTSFIVSPQIEKLVTKNATKVREIFTKVR